MHGARRADSPSVHATPLRETGVGRAASPGKRPGIGPGAYAGAMHGVRRDHGDSRNGGQHEHQMVVAHFIVSDDVERARPAFPPLLHRGTWRQDGHLRRSGRRRDVGRASQQLDHHQRRRRSERRQADRLLRSAPTRSPSTDGDAATGGAACGKTAGRSASAEARGCTRRTRATSATAGACARADQQGA